MAKNKTIKYTLKKEKTKKEDYYECKRCNKNSVKNPEYASCPCPRGGCEAQVVGKVVITTQIFIAPKKPVKKLTKKEKEEIDNACNIFNLDELQDVSFLPTLSLSKTTNEKKRKTRTRSKSNRK